MSIEINREKCVGCKKCEAVCPGSLIKIGSDGKAFIKYPRDCWGCTSCLKECSVKAIAFFLGADIGGRGSRVYTESSGDILTWIIEQPQGKITEIKINRKEANKY